MNLPAPSAELHELALFIGSWKGEGKFLPTAFSPAVAQPVIQSTGTFCLGGHWMEQRFAWIEKPLDECVPGDLRLAEAVQLWGFDGAGHLLVGHWFDSHGRHGTLTSRGCEGDRLVTGLMIRYGEQEVTARESFIKLGEHSWRHVGEVRTGSGWTQIDEQTFYRSPLP